MDQWHVAVGGKQEGPWPADEVIRRIRSGEIPRTAHVFRQGLASWEPVTSRAEFAEAFGGATVPPPPRPGSGTAHEIDYEIFGEEMHYDIQFVGGVKTALFGDEGLFFATLRGPGKVWLQSLPFSRFASRVFSAMPGNPAGRRQGEGSILGPLGDLLGGN